MPFVFIVEFQYKLILLAKSSINIEQKWINMDCTYRFLFLLREVLSEIKYEPENVVYSIL